MRYDFLSENQKGHNGEQELGSGYVLWEADWPTQINTSPCLLYHSAMCIDFYV